MKQITKHIYQINLGPVNAFVIDDNGLTLVDTGLPGSTEKIFTAIKTAGKRPKDIKQIILTHCHPDHTGSAADLKLQLNVPVLAHAVDADLIKKGIGGRPTQLTPGITNWLLYHLVIKKNNKKMPAVAVDEKLNDSDVIPLAGGIQVIHTPGHSAGHIALLVKEDGLLIAGDICSNIPKLAYAPLYEDRALGRESILKVAGFDFDKAVFGHGEALIGSANRKLKDKFTQTV